MPEYKIVQNFSMATKYQNVLVDGSSVTDTHCSCFWGPPMQRCIANRRCKIVTNFAKKSISDRHEVNKFSKET